jgi:hypothetical protein
MRSIQRLPALALSAALILGPTTVDAQEPGASGSIVNTAREWAKRTQILERMSGDIDGWYPRFGGLTRGAGITLGPGYRTHLLDNRVLLDVSGAISMRNYKAVDVHTRWLQAWQERVELWTDYRFEDFPQEDFYGTGPDAPYAARTSYRYRSSDLAFRAQVKPVPWLHTGLTAGYLHPAIGAGHDDSFPSIEQTFTDASAAGLLEQPNFFHAQLYADVDFRDAPANPKSGGFYHAAFGRWNDRTLDAYDFTRLDVNASQFAPLTPDKKHVVSGHLGVSLTNNADGDRVPFYVLPYVGGQDTIRSFREFRFQDENALWFSAEYRWIPIKWVSGALFADFGNVANDWQDVSSSLKHGYGFGFRVHSEKQTFFRIDFGYGGGEGQRIFLKLGPSF